MESSKKIGTMTVRAKEKVNVVPEDDVESSVIPRLEKVAIKNTQANERQIIFNNWSQGFEKQRQMMSEFIEPWVLPKSFTSECGGHVYLANLEIAMESVIQETVLHIEAERKLNGLIDEPQVYTDDNGPYQENFEIYGDDDDEGDEDDFPTIDDVTRVASNSFSEFEIRSLLTTMSTKNYCWDLGCQMATYVERTGDKKQYRFKCYCPFGTAHKIWRKEHGIEEMLQNNNHKRCKNSVFDSPFSLWNHCNNKGKDCILHFGLQKFLANIYEHIATQVS